MHSSHHSYPPLFATISDFDGWIILNCVWSQHRNLSFCTKFPSKMSICCSTHQHTVVIPAGKRLLLDTWPHFSSSFVIWLWLKHIYRAAWKVSAQNRIAAFWAGTGWPGHTISSSPQPVHSCSALMPVLSRNEHPCHQLSFVFYVVTAWSTQNLICLSLIWYSQSV